MTQAAPHRRLEMIGAATIGAIAASIILLPSLPMKLTLIGLVAAAPLLLWILAGPNRWLYAFFVAALLLPPLPIELGNSGPHVAIVFALAGLWIGVLHADRWQVRIDAGTGVLLIFVFILFASLAPAAIHSGWEIAAGSFARVLLFAISVYAFLFVRDGPFVMERAPALLRLLFFAGAGSALFACFDFYFQFPAPGRFGAQFLWLDAGVFRRAQGLFYEASTLGNLCAFFLVMIAAAFACRRRVLPVSNAGLLCGSIAFAGALVLSYSRAALVNAAVGMVAMLWLQRANLRLWRSLVGAVVAIAIGIGLLTAAVPVFTTAYGARLANSLQYFTESPNAVLSGRLETWRQLGDFLLSHPWQALTGVGFKTLSYSEFTGSAAVADNTYLSILTETGVAGFGALIALNIVILRGAYRAARSADAMRSFCGTCMFSFWCGQTVQMFSADLLTYWRILPIYFCIFALADRK